MSKKWISKDNVSKKVEEGLIPDFIAEGWTLGRIAATGNNNPFAGKKHSPETKQAMSEAKQDSIPWNKDKTDVYSLTTRQKMSDAKRGVSAPVKLDLIKKRDLAQFGYDACTITEEDIMKTLETGYCLACGRNDVILQIGRIDTSKPHTPDNIFCQCSICYRKKKSINTTTNHINTFNNVAIH